MTGRVDFIVGEELGTGVAVGPGEAVGCELGRRPVGCEVGLPVGCPVSPHRHPSQSHENWDSIIPHVYVGLMSSQ